MAITSDSEHMRLFLSRGNGANDFQSGGINYGDCLFKLGRHVEQTVLRAEQRTMRADALAEINIADNLAGCKIDHHHVAAISAGHPHAIFADETFAIGDEGRQTGRRDGFTLSFLLREFEVQVQEEGKEER